MKTLKIVLLIGFYIVTQICLGQKQPKFVIICTTSGDSAQKYAGAYERVMASYINDAFPCARTKTHGDIVTHVRSERLNQLLGGETDWSSFCDDLACDYLLNLELTEFMSNQYIVNASCISYPKVEVIARESMYGSKNFASLKDLLNKVSKSLAKKLGEFEICPYLGPVTIDVKSNRDEENTSTSPAPCVGGTLITTTIIKSNDVLNWKLSKVARRVTTGDVNYDLTENFKTIRSYSCYECKDGLETAMSFTDTHNSEAKVEGLSNESVSEGKKIDDARIQIVFKDNGTYMLLVEATSKKGILKETTETKAQGACEGEDKPPVTKNKSIDIPIKAVFGPYKGSPSDKILSQNETKDVSQGKEKTTVSIDFNLVRN